MIDFTPEIQEQILLHLKKLRLVQEQRTKELHDSILSLESSNAGFLSFSDLEAQKTHLTEKHKQLQAKRDALLERKNEKEARERSEEEARRKALDASNQDWLQQCAEKISLLDNASFVQIIDDMNQWIQEDKTLQDRFGGGSIEEIPLLKLQSNESWYINHAQTISQKLSQKLEVYVQKYAEREEIRTKRENAEKERDGVLLELHAVEQLLLEKGMTQELIGLFKKMNQAEEEYYYVQVLKRISDDISIEQSWNNHQNPLAELEENP